MTGGRPPWTPEQAWEWYDERPWQCGVNYVPSTAVNSTEMWQAATFDLATIERELAWARDVGLTCVRVFVQYLVWQDDPEGLLDRLDAFLGVADGNGMAAVVVLFDDCAFGEREPYLGPQDEPLPGIHNSGWTPSPGHGRVTDTAAWPGLRAYVTSVVGRFADDVRVLLWDLYNEPGNGGMGGRSLPLLAAAGGWAREAEPQQPVTVGVWRPGPTGLDGVDELTALSLEVSDVVTFHDYDDLPTTKAHVARLRAEGRPMLCTEWMRRAHGSHVETHLPWFRQERIGALFWGLVRGRTQTYFPWGSTAGAAEPELWFHDLLDPAGRPHRPEEIEILRAQLGGG